MSGRSWAVLLILLGSCGGTGKRKEAPRIRGPELDAVKLVEKARTHLARDEAAQAIDVLTLALESDPDSFEARVLRARAYLATGKPNAASVDASRAIALRPAPDLYRLRGRAYMRMGNLQGARADADAALHLKASDPANHAARIETLMMLGEYEEAIQACDAALKLGLTAELYTDRATAYWRLGNFEEATAGFARAAALDSLHARARCLWTVMQVTNHRTANHVVRKLSGPSFWVHIGWGFHLGATGQEEQAAKRLRQAVLADPEGHGPSFYRGMFYAANGDSAQALRDYDLALKKWPGHPDLLLARAAVLPHAEAVRQVDELLSRAPQHLGAMLLKVRLHADAREFAKGFRLLETARRSAPGSEGVRRAHVELYSRVQPEINRLVRGIRDPKLSLVRRELKLKQILEIYPLHFEARMGLARTLWVKQKRADAVQVWGEILEHEGYPAAERAAAHLERGNAYYEMNQYDRALSDFEKAAAGGAIVPDESLAHALISVGRHRDAVGLLGGIIKAKRRLTWAYNLRGECHAALHRYDEALDDFKNSIRADRDHQSPYRNRALVYEQKGDLEKAVELLNACVGRFPEFEAARKDLERIRGSFQERERQLRKAGRPEAHGLFGTLYGLQAQIDFDVLEGAAIDPKTGSLSLFGSRRPDAQFTPVPYLDLLGTALDAEPNQVTLRLAGPGKNRVAQALRMSDDDLATTVSSILQEDGTLNRRGVWFFNAAGIPVGGSGIWIGASLRADVGGVRVTEVQPHGPAQRANLRAGDLIIRVGKRPVRTVDGLGALLRAGVRSMLTVEREGRTAPYPLRPVLRASPDGLKGSELMAQLYDALGRSRAAKIWRAYEPMRKAANPDTFKAFVTAAGLWDSYAAVMRTAGSKDKAVDRFAPTLLRRLTQEFELSPTAATRTYRGHRDRRPAPDALQRTVREVMRDAAGSIASLLFDQKEVFVLGPDEIADVIGGSARAEPGFVGLPSSSRMARIALEADLVLKSLPHREDLRGMVPGYQSWFDWCRRTGEDLLTRGHVWIGPGKFRLRRSGDGQSIRFVNTPMEIHIEAYLPGRRTVSRESLNLYARHLSERFDHFARELPELHRLRECLKVLVVARWLKEQRFRISLPVGGRGRWEPESTYPAPIYLEFTTKVGGVSRAMLHAQGGVELKFKHQPNFVEGGAELDDFWSLAPFEREGSAIRKLMSRNPDVEPLRPPAWIAQSMGESRITLIRDRLRNGTSAAEAVAVLDEMEQDAKLILFYERVVEQAGSATALRDLSDEARAALSVLAAAAFDAVEKHLPGLDEAADLGVEQAILKSGEQDLIRKAGQIGERTRALIERLASLKIRLKAARTGRVQAERLREDAQGARKELRELMNLLDGPLPDALARHFDSAGRMLSAIQGLSRSLNQATVIWEFGVIASGLLAPGQFVDVARERAAELNDRFRKNEVLIRKLR